MICYNVVAERIVHGGSVVAVQLVMNRNAAVPVVKKDCGGDAKASEEEQPETLRK